MDQVLKVDGLSRKFHGRTVVDNISFAVNKGEIVGFLGPNGAGKSTTLQMLAGTLAVTSGQVTVNGIDLHASPRAAKSHIGYLPETPPLYPELTTREYLRFAARLRRIPAKALNGATDLAITHCGLQAVVNKPIAQLSKGYRQRVGIAQAIVHRPKLIMLDEPTDGLDPHQIIEIRSLIKTLAADSSIVVSSHILPEVQTLCQRALIIHRGRIVYDSGFNTEQQHYHVTFSRELAPTESESLDKRFVARQLTARTFELQSQQAADAETILRQLVELQMPVTRFTPQHDLESVFLRATTGDADT